MPCRIDSDDPLSKELPAIAQLNAAYFYALASSLHAEYDDVRGVRRAWQQHGDTSIKDWQSTFDEACVEEHAEEVAAQARARERAEQAAARERAERDLHDESWGGSDFGGGDCDDGGGGSGDW